MKEHTSGLLTIVIPCYNAEKYLQRCTASLNDLDDNEIAILFVNDGSTDATEKTVYDWIKRRKNAFIISKENGGYSSAISTGLDNCGSDYVMFLGVDDEIVPAGINRVCNQLRINHPDIIAFSTLKRFDDAQSNKDCFDSQTVYKAEGYYTNNVYDLCRIIGYDAQILFTRDTSRCFKMSVIGDLRYYGKTGIAADGCFSSLVALKSKSFEFINELCYIWHLHDDSVSGSGKTASKLIDEASVWKTYFSSLQKLEGAPYWPDFIISQLFAYKCLIQGLKRKEMTEVYNEHKEHIKQVLLWFRKNGRFSKKSRLKVSFPSLFTYYLQLEKRHRSE